MTDNTLAPGAVRTPSALAPARTSARITAVAGLLAGAALVVDTVTITAVNGSFGVLDDVLFLFGFAGLWVTAVALAIHVSAPHRGVARLGVAVVTFVAAVVVVGGASWAMDAMGRHVFSDSNVGLHGEWSFFTVGLCLLGIAGWAQRH